MLVELNIDLIWYLIFLIFKKHRILGFGLGAFAYLGLGTGIYL
jgi:hypothetical protein